MRSARKISDVAAAVAAVIIIGADSTTAVFAQSASGGSPSDCRDEQGLSYLCGFVVPEDVGAARDPETIIEE